MQLQHLLLRPMIREAPDQRILYLVHQDHPAPMACLEQTVLMEMTVLPALLAQEVHLVHQDHQDLVDLVREVPVVMAHPVHRETLANLVFPE